MRLYSIQPQLNKDGQLYLSQSEGLFNRLRAAGLSVRQLNDVGYVFLKDFEDLGPIMVEWLGPVGSFAPQSFNQITDKEYAA
jgi:hypothetical protein